jgi:hypothetical protein
MAGLGRKRSKEKREGLLLAGLRFQYLEMIADVYEFIPRMLIEDPGLDFMIIDTVCEESHQDAILDILIGVFRLILSDAAIDIVDGLFHIHLFLCGYLEWYFSTCDDGFYSIHTMIIFP